MRFQEKEKLGYEEVREEEKEKRKLETRKKKHCYYRLWIENRFNLG